MEILSLIITVVLSAVWYLAWTKTYLPFDVKGLIRHSLIFILLSIGIVFVMGKAVFAPVNESYSASNKSALGFLFMLLIQVFLCVCLFALAVTIGKYITKDDEYYQTHDKEKTDTK
ncbi:MAG: hypothetical protein IJ740_20235 [Ruminococcus sp.]|nr:hypothetical protein [Ruminococcus sp.]MBR1753175.1 hypothetical protein [Ruminococcus sp.]